jgi:hypothetical protein
MAETVVAPPLGRVIRYDKDAVGNDLTATLLWCDRHQEPVWVFGDGSYTCPHERVVEFNTDNHRIVTPPWETALTDGDVSGGH